MGPDYGIGDDPYAIGFDDEMGDDEVGAVVKAALKRQGVAPTRKGMGALSIKPTIRNALDRTLPGGGDPGRVTMCPIDSVSTIAAGATQSVTCRPQRRFRADRLTISPGSTNWLVNAIQIGVDPLFSTASGSVGGGAFDPLATQGANLRATTADPGIDITVSVTNTTAGALRFTGAFTGPTID